MSQDLQEANGEDIKVSISASYSYSGLIPHPSILEEFDRIVPGAAERIIDNFLEESWHRRRLQVTSFSQGHIRSIVGTGAVLITSLTFAITGAIVASSGHPWPGASFAGGGMVALVGMMVKLLKVFGEPGGDRSADGEE